MHVFCDESGGAGRDDSLFLAVAVPLAADRAARLMKSFRKATGLRGEVKGSRLSDRDRALFLDLLGRNAVPAATAVVCSGHDPLGNWAIGALDEQELWAELMVECSLPLGTGAASLAVTVDRRYHGSQGQRAQRRIAAALANRSGANRITVQFVDSAASDGVQIADILANTVYRDLTAARARRGFAEGLAAGLVAVRPLELKDRRPHWLEPATA